MSEFLLSARSRCAAVALSVLCAACSGGVKPSTAPIPAPAGSVASATPRIVAAASGRDITLAQLVDDAARADVIFFGEQHDDPQTHRAELALLTAVGERRGSVILSLEMFERDVQPLLDAYLAGRMTEADFRAQSRPWPNYEADYRPMVELAKAKGWPVIAANVPRRYASTVSRYGLPAIDSLNAADRAYVARELICPKDQYYANFVEVMGGGHSGAPQASAPASPMSGMTDLFYQAQCIKDETMAESIVMARTKVGVSAVVVHFTGSFHSDFGLGTVARVRRRMPALSTVVVSAVPIISPASPASAKASEYTDRGQFIIFVSRTLP